MLKEMPVDCQIVLLPSAKPCSLPLLLFTKNEGWGSGEEAPDCLSFLLCLHPGSFSLSLPVSQFLWQPIVCVQTHPFSNHMQYLAISGYRGSQNRLLPLPPSLLHRQGCQLRLCVEGKRALGKGLARGGPVWPRILPHARKGGSDCVFTPRAPSTHWHPWQKPWHKRERRQCGCPPGPSEMCTHSPQRIARKMLHHVQQGTVSRPSIFPS